MTDQKSYDCIILGGGIAGSSLASTLLQENPRMKLAIIEKRSKFPHKVGETLSDASILFFRRILKADSILKKYIKKGGLRFYFEGGEDLSSPSYRSPTNSWNIDRSKFDEDILNLALRKGAELFREWSFTEYKQDNLYTVKINNNEQEKELSTKWLIDASGRSRLLGAKQFGLKKYQDHPTAATWGHFKLKPDHKGFISKSNWSKWAVAPSEVAVEHFLGKGFWVWKIPIQNDLISLGIVYDKTHRKCLDKNPRKDFKLFLESYPKLDIFLKEYNLEKDFHLTHLPYQAEKYIDHRCAIIGDASGFVDPLFSPGIEIATQQILNLVPIITKDLKNKCIKQQCHRYNHWFKKTMSTRFAVYKDRYMVMDDFEIFSLWTQMDISGHINIHLIPAVICNYWLRVPPMFTSHTFKMYKFFKQRFIHLYEKKKELGIKSNRHHLTTYFKANHNPLWGTLTSLVFFKRYIGLELRVKWIETFQNRKVSSKKNQLLHEKS